MKLLVTQEGAVVGMYNDRLLPLAERLGTPVITRASNVEWEGASCQWQARGAETGPKSGELLAAASTREEALRLEHKAVESDLPSYA